MNVSKHGLEAAGYSEYSQTDVIEVAFGIILVYSLRGMFLEKDSEKKISRIISLGHNCTVIIAQSINEASKALAGDSFVDDEDKWLDDNKAHPPFLLIYFKSDTPLELRGGYRKEENNHIYTYDAFPQGKMEIRKWEDTEVPVLVTSLTVHLSSERQQVELIPVTRSIFGITKEGKTLFDSKLVSNAKISLSSPKSLEEINKALEKSRKLSSALTKDVCQHFYAALNEPDRMKAFLGYFQFIERYTHSTYKSLVYEKVVQVAFNVPQRVKQPAEKFFAQLFTDSKNLSQRFQWCSIIAWEKVQENDVADFHELKKIRDKLSHGEHIEENDLPVEKAKKLAMKLLDMMPT